MREGRGEGRGSGGGGVDLAAVDAALSAFAVTLERFVGLLQCGAVVIPIAQRTAASRHRRTRDG